MQLYIKNMVCDRCILVVRQQLDNLVYPIKTFSWAKQNWLNRLQLKK